MKYYISLFIVLVCISCVSKKVENSKTIAQTSKTKHEIFEYQEGDTTYIMQKYFLVLLKKGPNRNQSQEESAEIQKKHLEHLAWLDKLGKVSIVGPTEGHEAIAGFVVFNTETIKEADILAKLDPAVKAGRLVVEILPWWAAKGSKLK